MAAWGVRIDPDQSAQVVEDPHRPNIKVVQDRRVLELKLLDVVVEIQRHQRLDRSGLKKLGLKNLNGLARPRAHGAGFCVIHIWLDYSRIPAQPLYRFSGVPRQKCRNQREGEIKQCLQN